MKYLVSLTASATVNVSESIEAKTKDEAKEKFKSRLQTHFNHFDVDIVEPPIEGNDYDSDTIDVEPYKERDPQSLRTIAISDFALSHGMSIEDALKVHNVIEAHKDKL